MIGNEWINAKNSRTNWPATVTEDAETAQARPEIQKCLKYSEDGPTLLVLLADLHVEYKSAGIRRYFADDKDERQCLLVRLTRKSTGRSIEYEFGLSIQDTYFLSAGKVGRLVGLRPMTAQAIYKEGKEARQGILYSLLACARGDYYCPSSFPSFCDEFEYEEDSRKAFATWQACLVQSEKLRKVLRESEIDCLPS